MPSFDRVSDFFDLTKGEIPLVRDHAKQTGVALEKGYQFMLWLIPTVEKFPRAQKFLLGDRIESVTLDVVEGIVDATYTRKRAPILCISLTCVRLRATLARDSVFSSSWIEAAL